MHKTVTPKIQMSILSDFSFDQKWFLDGELKNPNCHEYNTFEGIP